MTMLFLPTQHIMVDIGCHSLIGAAVTWTRRTTIPICYSVTSDIFFKLSVKPLKKVMSTHNKALSLHHFFQNKSKSISM